MKVFLNVKSIILISFFVFSSITFAANPPQPFLPGDNIQDPGCLPTDSNCYVLLTSFTDENVTGLDYATSTGILSLTSGYNIPTTASTTAWNTAIGALGGSALLQNGNSFGNTLTLGTNDNNALSFETNNNTAMTILSNGNVGVGNTNPIEKLSVVSAGPGLFSLKNSSLSGNGSQWNFDVFQNQLLIGRAGVNSDFGLLADGNAFFTGNVGIGTTTPTAKLAITGTAGSGNVFVVASSTNAQMFTVAANGNVGIGDTNPVSKLVVSGNQASSSLLSENGLALFGNTNNVFLEIGAEVNAPWGMWLQSKKPTADQAFPLTLNPLGGNVGIGLLNPTQKLSVSGSVLLTNNLYLPTVSSTDGIIYTNGSRYIHGSTESFYAGLNSGSLTAGANGNVGVGKGALDAISSNNGQNVAIGVDALGSLSGGGANSYGNVALGWNALASLVDAGANVGIGRQALALTTGSGNIGIGGGNVGIVNTTGTNNIFLGNNSQPGSSGLTNAIAIGYNSVVGASNSMSLGNGVNVGIGSTTPSARLSVAGAGTGTGLLAQFTDSANVARFTVLDNGATTVGGPLTLNQVSVGSGNSGSSLSANLNSIFGINNTDSVSNSGSRNTIVGFSNSLSGSVNSSRNVLFGTENTISGAVERSYNGAFGIGNTVTSTVGGFAFGRGITNSTDNSVMIGPSDSAKVTILSSGNLGVGTTNPNANINILSSSPVLNVQSSVGNAGTIKISNLNNGPILTLSTDSSAYSYITSGGDMNLGTTAGGSNLLFKTANSLRMKIDTNGNVGIGNYTFTSLFNVGPSNDFQVTSSGRVLANVGASGAGNLSYSFVGDTNTGLYRSATDEIRFQNNGADTLTISAAGNLGIGTTTPTQRLSVAGNAQFTGVTSGTYAFDLNLTSDGTLTTSASDINLKDNIMLISSTSTLDKLSQLKPSSFTWKSNNSADIGLIAQEVELIFPELVFTNPTDGYKGINYTRFITLLISAVQELSKKITGFSQEFRTEKLCVGNTCVTEAQLQLLLQNQNVQPTVYVPEVIPPVVDKVVEEEVVEDPVVDEVVVEPVVEETPAIDISI